MTFGKMEGKNSAQPVKNKYELSDRELRYFKQSVLNAEKIAEASGYDIVSPDGLYIVGCLIPVMARHRYYIPTMFAQEDSEEKVRFKAASENAGV